MAIITTASASILPENALAGTGSTSRSSLAAGFGLLEALSLVFGVALEVAFPAVDAEGFLPVGILLPPAGVDGFGVDRVPPNSALMTSPPSEPDSVEPVPAALLAAVRGPAPAVRVSLDGRPVPEGPPRASALGTFGRRVAMTLL
ncbi:hypothetical protein J3D46_002285 [Paenarthrobacter sp. A20]|nr:hypothetical protein [Paenarthrobacter sp. A20]